MIKVSFEIAPQSDPEKAVENIIKDSVGRDIALGGFEIRKKSLDSRKGRNRFVYNVDVSVAQEDENEAASRLGGAVCEKEEEYSFPAPVSVPEIRPVVAGFGPAGMFASLCLSKAGYRPIVLERGRDVDTREKDVKSFFKSGEPDENSNIQFGEGGAGAFSDGKLNTLVRDKSFRGGFVLRELVKAGAPKEILYLSHPHIGTDLLRGVVKNVREEIISLGGEIAFGESLTDITVSPEGKLSSVITQKREIKTNALFLATGQSSEDVYKTLYRHGADMEQKPFSVGFRIEHPQSLINASQYGENGDMRFLPPAEYKLFSHTNTGRTVYSFCMCPGGEVIAAASERERLVTNGMSYHARSGSNANAAILCEVLPKDLGPGLFAGFEYRKNLEKRAFELGGGRFAAPAMPLASLFGSDSAPAVCTTYPLGVKMCDLTPLFNAEMIESFRFAFKEFGKKIKGFDLPGAMLTAVESRTSSPLRIIRGDDRQSNIKGLFPLGEGAGHAGGIMSAAIDGVKSAEEFVKGSII
ncbi:MAG: hypothetical protein J5793_03815 [Clostridia bacterium]|nr:hypothetical protein [Clostridia bacterium]